MKVYISKYRDHWISPYTVCEKICFWREIDYNEPWVQRLVKVLTPVCELWRKFLDLVHPRVEYVKIDPYDVWSMDSTLGLIVVPMLKELKRVKHGAPNVDLADVPKYLHPTKAEQKKFDTDGSTDKNFFKRWDYVIDEMIWAHEQIISDDGDGQFYDHSRAKDPNDDLNTQVDKIKVDHKGLKAYHDRIDNGLRLFGKYYRSLWD